MASTSLLMRRDDDDEMNEADRDDLLVHYYHADTNRGRVLLYVINCFFIDWY